MIRPRRSVLYMPAANARALDKARQLPADVLVFDLEDAVAPSAKAAARAQLLAALAEGGYGQRELVVRVNGSGTPWYEEDLAAMAGAPVDAVCLPKVETPDQVEATVHFLEQAGAAEKLCLWVMAETPTGVFNIRQIAQAHPRIDAIMLGTSDLATELRARHTADRQPFLFALSQCVMAAREAGLDIIDGVHLALDDAPGLAAVCEQGRDLGFDGKSLIHPKQIDAANAAFAPTPAQIEHAERLINAWREAEREGKAVLVLDGKLVENLHVREAERVLALAAAIEALSI